MTTKSIKHYILAGVLYCGAAAAFTACSEWDDHYESPVDVAGSELTLWQTMQQHPELSDFRDVLSQTMVFKHHKKTDISYAQLLDGSQTLTVLAPVNGSFNKDSVLYLLSTNRGDSMVVRSFVGNHLSYNLTTSVDKPVEFFLLNNKRATMAGGQALDVPLKEANVKAKGGIMHVLQGTLPYRYNLYEIMLNDPRYSLIGEQMSSYEQDEFSPTQSVEGGMVDGEQIYADSVFIERNHLLESVGELFAEDSTYLFVVPTADEWQRVWQEAMSYYRYDATVGNGDSLQRYWANYALLGDAIFSRTIQASPEDSLVTYAYNRRYPQYHVFHRPFDQGGILYGATATEYSNGTLYTTSHWLFTPQATYQRELKVEGERTGMIIDNTYSTIETRRLVADSISENEYLVITPETNASNWTVTFKLENTLAGTYDICAVILPATVYNPGADLRPCKFNAEINFVDETGAARTFDCNATKFSNDPAKVDTVVLAEDFVFPVCNYGQSNLKFTLKLKCNILARETKNFSRGNNSRRMHIDGTGIGLNLCKMIVDMHHGTIEAQNRTDVKGSVFTVTLPLGSSHLKPEEMEATPAPTQESAPPASEGGAPASSSRRRVLVVDDDLEIGHYISSELGRYYKFGICPNGKEGLKELLTNEYDVVVSDVMMPEMDGFTMLRMIKTNLNLSHLPVIMLTSKADVGNRLEGLERGADAFLAKPFDMEELHLTIENLIQGRRHLRGKFSGAQQQADKLEQPEVKGNDEQLMERIMKVVNKYLSDSDFNVEMLCKEVGISRTQLHRKMKELTGLSTSEFIRNIRLEQAARLLKEQKINVTQVAYTVGFSNLAHFSTVFRKHFGVAPSEYAEKE